MSQEKLSNEHSEFVQLRWLLYEKGKPLETAVLKAASLLGFKAGEFRDSESEFDVVLESMEARAIGEVQGKDSSAIAISKFRQLQTNILEDFEKRGSDDPAKAVLFGNAYRLEPPESRGEFFTERCLKAAKRFRVALVRTTDLFLAVQYLCRKSDNEFARGCRKAILETEGAVVQFPKPDASP